LSNSLLSEYSLGLSDLMPDRSSMTHDLAVNLGTRVLCFDTCIGIYIPYYHIATRDLSISQLWKMISLISNSVGMAKVILNQTGDYARNSKLKYLWNRCFTADTITRSCARLFSARLAREL